MSNADFGRSSGGRALIMLPTGKAREFANVTRRAPLHASNVICCTLTLAAWFLRASPSAKQDPLGHKSIQHTVCHTELGAYAVQEPLP